MIYVGIIIMIAMVFMLGYAVGTMAQGRRRR